MDQYISKSALAEEIKKRKKEAESNCGGYKSGDEHRCDSCTVGFYEEFLEILDTIEVKEVDLEKEFDKCCENYTFDDECEVYTAKHFFELGFKAREKR